MCEMLFQVCFEGGIYSNFVCFYYNRNVRFGTMLIVLHGSYDWAQYDQVLHFQVKSVFLIWYISNYKVFAIKVILAYSQRIDLILFRLGHCISSILGYLLLIVYVVGILFPRFG